MIREQLPAYEGPLDQQWITQEQAERQGYLPMEFKGTIVGYRWQETSQSESSKSS